MAPRQENTKRSTHGVPAASPSYKPMKPFPFSSASIAAVFLASLPASALRQSAAGGRRQADSLFLPDLPESPADRAKNLHNICAAAQYKPVLRQLARHRPRSLAPLSNSGSTAVPKESHLKNDPIFQRDPVSAICILWEGQMA